tara:strand:- start:667 stop:924 length:258 start_codon:yes stop_codon:yes gene_type:complete
VVAFLVLRLNVLGIFRREFVDASVHQREFRNKNLFFVEEVLDKLYPFVLFAHEAFLALFSQLQHVLGRDLVFGKGGSDVYMPHSF